MRSDMVPGAIFPDYELSDHTPKHRNLSELQGLDPMIVVLSRGAFCPKDRRQAEGLLQLHREMEAGWSRSALTTSPRPTKTGTGSARTGHFCQIRGGSFRRTLILPSTPIRSTTR